MKILYALWNYPQLSETYIAAEIKYAGALGAQIEVWAEEDRHSGLPKVPVHRGTLQEAIEAVKPDLVHFHYLAMAERWVGAVGDLPVTVRGHSFDWSEAGAHRVVEFQEVKRVYLFPHFARQVAGLKVRAMRVGYDPDLYRHTNKLWKRVIRTAAGLPNKGLADFFAVAAASSSSFQFNLVVATTGGKPDFPKQLVDASRESGGRVQVYVDASPETVQALMALSGFYLYTRDRKSHDFGMPISIVEALATGCHVLVPEHPKARAYLNGLDSSCVTFYETPDEAARQIAQVAARPLEQLRDMQLRSESFASLYRAPDVARELVDDWMEIIKESGK